jgi:hypothetical protein
MYPITLICVPMMRNALMRRFTKLFSIALLLYNEFQIVAYNAKNQIDFTSSELKFYSKSSYCRRCIFDNVFPTPRGNLTS